jgi:hypothetical protein
MSETVGDKLHCPEGNNPYHRLRTKSTETQTQSKMDLFQNSLASSFSTAQITVEPKYQGQDRVADFYGSLWISIVNSYGYSMSDLTYP